MIENSFIINFKIPRNKKKDKLISIQGVCSKINSSAIYGINPNLDKILNFQGEKNVRKQKLQSTNQNTSRVKRKIREESRRYRSKLKRVYKIYVCKRGKRELTQSSLNSKSIVKHSKNIDKSILIQYNFNSKTLKKDCIVQNLLKTTNQIIGTENQQTVNARDIWKYVESNKKFADWIKKRLFQLGAIENSDFICIHQKVKAGNNAIMKEYIVTLDIAKHLGMMERNVKGYEVRDYFIQIEKKYFRALEVAKNQMKQGYLLQLCHRDKKIERLKEKLNLNTDYKAKYEDYKEKYEKQRDMFVDMYEKYWELKSFVNIMKDKVNQINL